MENRDSEILISDQDSQILVTYRHKQGILAYRIPQHDLARLNLLEKLVVEARAEIERRVDQGFKEETGELVLDRKVISESHDLRRSFVRPARAREGKGPRAFVLSSRERFYVLAWCRGEHDDTAVVKRSVIKAIRRAWTSLRRECQCLRKHNSWEYYSQHIKREISFHSMATQLRLSLVLSPVIDTRPLVQKAFKKMIDFSRRVS